jgi:hypothetical protein
VALQLQYAYVSGWPLAIPGGRTFQDEGDFNGHEGQQACDYGSLDGCSPCSCACSRGCCPDGEC